MSRLDVVCEMPDFEFFGGQLSGWRVGSTPTDRGYVIELKPGFASEIQVPWMHDLRVELLEPTPLHGTNIQLSDGPGRSGGLRTVSGRPHENFPFELIGGEVIEVDHPIGASEQAPAFFRATILGTRINEERLARVNQGPAVYAPSMKSLRFHSQNPDFPVQRIEADGHEFFRGNPGQAADYLRRNSGDTSKLYMMLNALGREIATAECNLYVD